MLNIALHSSAMSQEEKIKALNACLQQKTLLQKLSRDYPGMTLPSNIAMALDSIYGKIRVFDSRDVDIRDLEFDPAAKRLKLELRTGRTPSLILSSDLPPADSRFKRSDDGRIRLPLSPETEQRFEIQLKQD